MQDTTHKVPENRFTSCPYDEPILEYYNGYFEAVYILLHPFMHSSKIDLKNKPRETLLRKQEIISDCEAVSWNEVMKLSGFSSLSEIDIGLRTSIRGLKEELCNYDFASRIRDLFDNKSIKPHMEGKIPALLENSLLYALKNIGYDELCVSDEFGDETKKFLIDELIAGDEIPFHGHIYDPDHKFLITTHWDSHCSFFCGPKEFLNKIIEIEQFEGFFCTPKTEVYWGVSPI